MYVIMATLWLKHIGEFYRRDAFEAIQATDPHLKTLDFVIEVPRTLLDMGRKWISRGGHDQAEWFIAQARQLLSLCTDVESDRVFGLKSDVLLESLQLAFVSNQKVSEGEE
jgi:hypothetical protein